MVIEVVVGYMLKCLKNNIDISKYKDEFSSIRHGDYDKFISLINVGSTPMVFYNAGDIKTEGLTHKNTCDFGGILLAGKALKEFYYKCVNDFGVFLDNSISDLSYEKLVFFEISLRLHANNNNIGERDLNNIINNIGSFFNLEVNEINSLHDCRKLLNNVKHKPNKINVMSVESIIENAFNVIDKYKLKIL